MRPEREQALANPLQTKTHETGARRPPGKPGTLAPLRSGAADHVCRVQALRSLLAFELNRVPFIQRLVSRLLDRGKMHKNVFTRRPLNETVSLRSIEPLDYATFLHRNSFLSRHLRVFRKRQKPPRRAGARRGGSLGVAGNIPRTAEQIHQPGPSEDSIAGGPAKAFVVTVMAGIQIQRKKKVAIGHTRFLAE